MEKGGPQHLPGAQGPSPRPALPGTVGPAAAAWQRGPGDVAAVLVARAGSCCRQVPNAWAPACQSQGLLDSLVPSGRALPSLALDRLRRGRQPHLGHGEGMHDIFLLYQRWGNRLREAMQTALGYTAGQRPSLLLFCLFESGTPPETPGSHPPHSHRDAVCVPALSGDREGRAIEALNPWTQLRPKFGGEGAKGTFLQGRVP